MITIIKSNGKSQQQQNTDVVHMYLCPSDKISRGNIDLDPSELHNMYNDDVLCTIVIKTKCQRQNKAHGNTKLSQSKL